MKTKILIFINVIDNGGSANLLTTILNGIDYSLFEITILTIGTNSKCEKKINQNVRIRHLFKKDPYLSKHRLVRLVYGFFKELIPGWLLRLFLIKSKPDIAIDFKGLNLKLLTACKCTKILWSQKDYSLKTNPVERMYVETNKNKFTFKYKEKSFSKKLTRLDKVVCLTNNLKDSFSQRWNYPDDKIVVINNVLDIDKIRKQSDEQIDYIKPSSFTFCCMSRLAFGKGIERLFCAVQKLNEDGYIFSLDIVGGGIGFDYLCQMLKEMNIHNVRLLGNKDNPFPYVKAADAAIIPSETESYGLSFCETVAVGTPVIATNVGIAPEVLKDGRYGLLVENSFEGIYNGMKRFLDDGPFVKKLRNNDIGDCCYFDNKSIFKQIEKLLYVKNS